jgi:hypothetical protein
MVIEPAPLEILIPAPGVIVVATGSAPVLPTSNCPFVNTIDVAGDAPSPTKIPCAVGLATPRPPCVADRGNGALTELFVVIVYLLDVN